MKACHTILIALCFLLHAGTKAQSSKTDTIQWDNGNVTLLSDLNKVWIILKKGNDLKDVRIHEIRKEKGVLVYEKDKCLHDIYINNIKKIEPGKYAMNSMFFYADNTPYIKEEYRRMDAAVNYSSFKSIIRAETVVKQEPVIEAKPAETTEVEEKDFTPSSTKCDTIIDALGNITLVKVLDVTARLISYKKLSNMDGPVYIKANNNATITRYDDCIAIKFH